MQFETHLIQLLTQHVGVLVEVVLAVLQLLHVQLTLFQIFLQSCHLVLQLGDVAELLLAGMVLVEMQLGRLFLYDHGFILQFGLQFLI